MKKGSRLEENEAILQSLLDDFLVTDAKGLILRVSHAMKQLYGLEEKDIIGESVYELEKQGVFTPIVTPLVKEKKERVTIIQTAKENKKFLVTGVPVFDEKGRLWRIATYSHDVTELANMKDYLGEMEDEMERVKNEIQILRNRYFQEHGFIAHSPEMKSCLDVAHQVASVDVNVLLLGESGVGKTQLAKMIHQESPRRKEPFIEVNCGAIPDSLFEAEFFGYEAGAFTGSSQKGKIGFAELAEGGTLFLDEIGELSLAHQVKVLKFIQEKTFYRVGGNKQRKVNFRLISATNRPLEELVEEKKFREDLYFRLNVVPITIPPLRERASDIIPLIHYLVDSFGKKYGGKKELEPQVMQELCNKEWKGNVRELMNVLERLIVTSSSNKITKEHLQSMNKKQKGPAVFQENSKSLTELIEDYEKTILQEAYNKHKTTVKIAEKLGTSQPTVARKLKKYKIN